MAIKTNRTLDQMKKHKILWKNTRSGTSASDHTL